MLNLVHKIKKDSELLVLDIGKGKPHTELHERALNILINSIELENSLKDDSSSKTNAASQNNPRNQTKAHITTDSLEKNRIDKEKNRVKKKLKRWAHHPEQYNHKILKKYLELKNNHVGEITEELLGRALMNDDSITGLNIFYTNFSQMKTDAKKSHGKIFETVNGAIEIWPPVLEYVDDFKNQIKTE